MDCCFRGLERLCRYLARPALAAGRLLDRLGWAALLARVFTTDLSACPACGGRQRIIAALTDPASIRRYPVAVGLPLKAPPRAPPQLEFECALWPSFLDRSR